MSLKKKKEKKKKKLPYVSSVRIFFFCITMFLSMQINIPSLQYGTFDNKYFRVQMERTGFQQAYFQPVAHNFVGLDSSMHGNLSLSICLHLIKHMFKSSLEKGCLPEKRSRGMLFSASDTELSQWVLQTAIQKLSCFQNSLLHLSVFFKGMKGIHET